MTGRVVPTLLTCYLSFISDNTHQECYIVCSGVFCVAYSYIVENMDNFALKSAIKRKLEKLHTR